MKRAFPTRQRTIWFVAIASIVFGAAGCEEKVYQIEQWPREDKLWRRLTLTRHQPGENGRKQFLNDKDKPEIERIARLYGGAPKVNVEKATFVGAFAHALPQDVGGDGHYVRWESTLGRVCLYVERFRGSDDVAAALAVRRKTVDQLVDLIIGWLDSELHGEAEWPALRKFFNTTFRQDLDNLSLYGWLVQTAPESEAKQRYLDIAFRVTQYLVERHYASYEEAPALLRELDDLNRRTTGGPFMARIRRLLVARAGAAENGRLAHALGFLNDAQTAWASWERYFRTTAYYKQEREEYRRKKQAERRGPDVAATVKAGAAKPESALPAIDNKEFEQSLYFKLLDAFLNVRLFGNTSRAQVSLETPREPFWTNGKWVPDKLKVEWSQQIAELGDTAGANAPWPTLCFAAWDEPNEATQKQLLGKVGIKGDDLFQYNLWYQGLTSAEKAEWDVFLPAAARDGDLADRLESFLFSDEPAGRNGIDRVAADGANALLTVLQLHKEGTATKNDAASNAANNREQPQKNEPKR
jgi:hypothetical protein